MQTTAIRTVANSLPENEVILLTLLISKRYIPLYRFTEIFCIIDEFDKNFESELKKNLLPVTDGKQHRNRKASLSDSEIMTILLLFHFGTYRNFDDSAESVPL